MKDQNSTINYIELYSKDLNATMDFYNQAFAWTFTMYGDSYIGIDNAGLDGGFELTEGPIVNGALVILYHEDLKKIQAKVIAAGGKISKEIFSFPGGKRFHFLDPSGNELAVWTKD
jgi:predicted enzyme related to lactoylglutathione lyase